MANACLRRVAVSAIRALAARLVDSVQPMAGGCFLTAPPTRVKASLVTTGFFGPRACQRLWGNEAAVSGILQRRSVELS